MGKEKKKKKDKVSEEWSRERNSIKCNIRDKHMQQTLSVAIFSMSALNVNNF